MKTIRRHATLFHYDGPQVVEARDPAERPCIILMIEPQNGVPHCLAVDVDPLRLGQFRRGFVDLRTLLVDRPAPGWYLAAVPDLWTDPLQLQPGKGPLEDTSFLPDPGFVLPCPSVALNAQTPNIPSPAPEPAPPLPV